MRFLPRGLAIGSSAMVLVGSAAMAPACGSDSSCEETRSCAGQGTGGKEGGLGGDSAVEAPQPCEKNEDCENGLVCDGVATCVDKVCVPGVPVECINPDAAHCTTTCTESTGVCAVHASDQDGDEHLDPLCTNSTVTTGPEDDCDDSNAAVYPGAVEVCDGVDNDCDDTGDFGEGFTISGTSEDFVTTSVVGHPAIAWSSTAQKYGVVWEDERFVTGGDEEVMFALMNPDGTKSGTDIRVSNGVNASYWPRIAAGNGSFGIAWGDSRDSGYDIYFRRFDESGGPLTAEKRLTTDAEPSEVADIVSIADGWIIVFADTLPTGLIYGMRIGLDGNILKAKTLIGTQTGKNTLPRIALAGSSLGVMWSKLGSTTTQFRVAYVSTDFDFNVTNGPVDISPAAAANTGGVMGDITPNGTDDGFTLAYFNFQVPRAPSYAEIGTNGIADCGPTIEPTVVTDGTVGEVVRYPGGGAFVHADGVGPNTSILVSTFDAGCLHYKSESLDTVTTSEVNPFVASAASGEAGVAFVWADTAQKVVRRRVTGPNLCD